MRAGFYECDVTPPLGGHMPGYYRINPAETVFERLYAKAMVVEDNGNYAAILALDTCEYIDTMTSVIEERVRAYTGIDPDALCLHVVHTHKGAPLEDCPWVGQKADDAYRDVCFRLAADAIVLAYQRMVEVEATFGCGEVPDVAFNRNYVLENGCAVSFGTGGKPALGMLAGTDPSLPVMTFWHDHTPIGALISFACHQDCTGREVNGYSGDYSAVLSQELKRTYGEHFVSLFMIGTAGDINHIHNDPSVQRPPFYYREIGKKLACEAIRVIRCSEPVGGGVAVIKEPIVLKLRQADTESTKKQLAEWTERGSLMRVRNLAYYHQVNRATEDTLILQVIRIGNTYIYVYPGEIYVNFGLRIKRETPYKNCFVIENSNCFGGYIPTPEAFADGNDLYETSLCFGSRHTPDAGDLMTDRLLEMGKQLID